MPLGLDAPESAVGPMSFDMATMPHGNWLTRIAVCLAALGPAPEGLETTGDPSPNAPWTALGVPAIAVPLPVEGGPCAIQMTGAWGRDDALVSVAEQLEKFLRA